MPNAKLEYLFAQHMAKTSTEAEKQELAVMLLSPQFEEDIKELLQKAWETDTAFENMPAQKAGEIVNSILKSDALLVKEGTVRSFYLWKKIAAAAAILLVLSVGSYMVFKDKPAQQLAVNEKPVKNTSNDIIAPAVAKAKITLANGRVVPIDSISSGILATQDGVNLVKNADGQLVYNAAKAQGEMQYNTLANPRGSRVVDMVLADGSRVWLNAGSSLTYPVAFTGNDRKVAITGEAYFEVVHNEAKPFKVTYGKTEITDLGTEFNVNAYEDESNVKVTLLQGSVKVYRSSVANNKGIIMRPGEQAQVADDIKLVKGVDVDKVMAWKNGVFNFQDATLEEVMHQLEKWYDIEVRYEKAVPKFEFVGKMSRTLNLSEVLHGLEVSKVHFRLEQGRKVVVLP
jgi:transmembrane sensor